MRGLNAEGILGVFAGRDYGVMADGQVDDARAIQRAITAAQVAGGGQVWLPSDATAVAIGATILLFDDIDLVIPAGCTLRLLPGSNCDMIANADPVGGNSRIRISGAGVIDGNRAGQTADSSGIKLVKCDDAQIQITIQNCYTDGLVLDSCGRPVLNVASKFNGRHGVYVKASSFPVGNVVAMNNGQRVAASGLVFDGLAGLGSTDASLLLVATDSQLFKTQQYGVLEIAGSGCDRNTMIGSCMGNVLGSAHLEGGSSILVGGLVSGLIVLDGGAAVSIPLASYDGGAALANASNVFDGGTAAG